MYARALELWGSKQKAWEQASKKVSKKQRRGKAEIARQALQDEYEEHVRQYLEEGLSRKGVGGQDTIESC